MSEAGHREVRAAHERAAENLREQRRIAERNHEHTERARQEFEDSERGDVARANAEAERIMRLPTPEALAELGAVIGDPTRGPSS